MALLFTSPRYKATDINNVPVSGALIAFYSQDQSAFQPVYADSSLSQSSLLPNPVKADDNGLFPAIYLDDSLPPYKVIFQNADGTTAPEESVNPYNPAPDTFELTDAEIASGFTLATIDALQLPGTALRIKLVANLASAAEANTAILKQLVSPQGSAGTFAGKFEFQNSFGVATYYFNDIITFRDGIQVELNNCTMSFSKAPVATDTNAGFVMAVRDFSIQNGAIVVNYAPGGESTDSGNCLAFGNRGTDCSYFSPMWDSLQLTASGSFNPMGNIVVRNMRLKTNSSEGSGIFMIGGLQRMVIEDNFIDGAGAAFCGIFYEFGWATNEPDRFNRQTSHMHNFRINNNTVVNLATVNSVAIRLGGAYGGEINGGYIKGVVNAIEIDPAEALFYRPQVGVDDVGGKRSIAVNRVVVESCTGLGISAQGAELAYAGYLAVAQGGPVDPSADFDVLTDLLDIVIDGVALQGTGNNYGVSSSAGKLTLRNSRIVGFQHGINTTGDCTKGIIETTEVLDSTSFGINIGQTLNVYSTPRLSSLIIRGCMIAGSGAGVPGTPAPAPGIAAAQTASLLIEGCRFGYELAHDNKAEATQTNAVDLAATCSGVICRSNYVAAAVSSVAYAQVGATGSQGCAIENPLGNVKTYSGNWDGVLQSVSMTIGAAVVGSGLAFTYTVNQFDYIKKDGKITGTFEIVTSAANLGSASGNLLLHGLPVAVSNAASINSEAIGPLAFSGITKTSYTSFSLAGSGGSTDLNIVASGSGQAIATLAITELTPASGVVKLYGSLSYFA